MIALCQRKNDRDIIKIKRENCCGAHWNLLFEMNFFTTHVAGSAPRCFHGKSEADLTVAEEKTM